MLGLVVPVNRDGLIGAGGPVMDSSSSIASPTFHGPCSPDSTKSGSDNRLSGRAAAEPRGSKSAAPYSWKNSCTSALEI